MSHTASLSKQLSFMAPFTARLLALCVTWKGVGWSQLFWVTSDYQLQQAHRVRIIKDQCVVGVLEGALYFLDVIGTTADINLGVLWILNG